ncbi:MAG: hypothetical protein AMXMBFR47_31720 [Planctomycetota bacterium]
MTAAQARTPAGGDPAALETTLRGLLAEIARSGAPPSRAGLAIPGIRDASGAVMLRAVNLPALANVNLLDLLRRAGCEDAVVESDANAAGWAQWHAASAAARIDRFVYLSLGTGVGGCVILDGAIVRHTRGGPGHLGHLIVDTSADAPLCPCGARGCFEAVLQNARSAGGGTLDAAGGERTAAALALLMLDIAHLYAPDRVLLGGGVIDHCPALVDLARDRFTRIQSRIAPPDLALFPAPLPSNDAGMIGAALLAAAR